MSRRKAATEEIFDAIVSARVLTSEAHTATAFWHAQMALVRVVHDGNADAARDMAKWILANLPSAVDYVAKTAAPYPKVKVPKGFGRTARKRVKL